jgi:hypothetical protein
MGTSTGLPDVERGLRRPGEYFFEDGLWEIAMGLWFGLTLALPLLVLGPLEDSGWLLLYAGLVGALGLRPVVVAAKDRWVHPRTGHVRYPDPGTGPTRISLGLDPATRPTVGPASQRRAAYMRLLLLPGACTLLVGAGFGLSRRLGFGDAGGHVTVGFALGIAFLVAARRWQRLRWIVLAVWLPLLGLLMASIDVGRGRAVAEHAAAIAATLVASGAVAFAGYLRRAPEPLPEADGQ